jgi:hypothetical protein
MELQKQRGTLPITNWHLDCHVAHMTRVNYWLARAMCVGYVPATWQTRCWSDGLCRLGSDRPEDSKLDCKKISTNCVKSGRHVAHVTRVNCWLVHTIYEATSAWHVVKSDFDRTVHVPRILIGLSNLIFDQSFCKLPFDMWQTYGRHEAYFHWTVHVDWTSDRTVQGFFEKHTYTHTTTTRKRRMHSTACDLVGDSGLP